MPTPVIETSEGGQQVEWSETFHAFLFRARIYLKRFWWIVIFTVAAGVIVQKWKMRDATPTYVSRAEMNVSNLVSSLSTGASINEMVANFFQNQIHLMQSEDVQQNAKMQVCALHPEYLNNTPWVIPDALVLPGTSILQLTAKGSDPKFTQYFLDTWMGVYLQSRDDKRQQVYDSYTIALEKSGNKIKAQMDALMVDRDTFVSSHTFASVGAAETAANEALAKLSAVTDQINEMNAQLDFLKTANANAKLIDDGKFKDYVNGTNSTGDHVEEIDRELASLKLLPPNADYQTAKDTFLSLQTQFDQLSIGLGKRHPTMANLTNNLERMQGNLRELRLQRVAQLEAEKDYLKVELAAALESQRALETTTKDDNKIRTKIEDYTTQIEMLKTTYASTLQSTASLRENREIGQEMLQINLHATPALEQTVNPLRPIAEGAFIGLVAGVIIIFLLGALDGRVMSVEDLTQRFDEPMLGVIPMQKRTNGQVELLKHGDQRQMFAESCRNIRSSLLYMDRQGQRPRIIMLTSSMPSEGKSTLSSNLAITLGFAASRTLLVDADMRRGQLHKRFGLPNDVGLAEHIANNVPLEQVIRPTGSENLDFISCGKYPAQPGELLMSDRFRDSIQTLRQRYDFVVFDSPPILLTDDAASFATRADAVIFVVRAGFTRLRQVRTSLENLHRRGVNVYGMVVNFIDHREPGYYSYRYYDYYSHQPELPERKDRKNRSA